MLKTYLNRVVVGLNIVAGLSAAIAVPLANLDTSSTIGVATGLGAITTACVTFLVGWQKHEERVADTTHFHMNSTTLGGVEWEPPVKN